MTTADSYSSSAPVGSTSPHGCRQSVTASSTRCEQLREAEHNLTVERSGFAKLTRGLVKLDVGQAVALSVGLTVGSMAVVMNLAPAIVNAVSSEISNNSGVWNEAGVFLDFSIAAADYQTAWFRAAVLVTFPALIWASYQFHLRRIARDSNLRLDERIHERTRIARELHDTLLQSVQGSVLRIQSARDLLPADPEKAIAALDGALDRADQAIVEGRDAIQNLRSSTIASNELAQSIVTLGQELTSGLDSVRGTALFRMFVEGSPRELHPVVRDDVQRISREALRNAFFHARASHIEAELTYGARELRVRIRDDGKGIDQEHLSSGRARHWGLTSMRERAAQIGAQLNLWSEMGAGTEVELRIPGSVAYGAPTPRRPISIRL